MIPISNITKTNAITIYEIKVKYSLNIDGYDFMTTFLFIIA